MTTVSTVVEPVREEPPAGPAPSWSRLGLLGAILVFLTVSIVWLIADARILDWDSGRHVFNTWAMRDALAGGDLLAPIELDNVNHYPPLLYLVGSLGMAIGGWQSLDSAQLAMNLVFVPALAVGCWGTARLAYGELAGVLAAVFALGAPMVASAFHLYMLDVPQAAMVAVTVWLLLASRRFERTGIAALAGAAGAGAMLVKPTTVFFLLGPVVVVLLRGGWRHWRGLLAFLVVGAVLAAPWYITQLDALRILAQGAAGPSSTPAPGGGSSYITPPRWSVENWLWYAWNLMNIQLMAPLFLSFVAGLVVAIARFVRDRRPDDYTPELVIGGLVAYVGVTYVSLKDSRYSLSVLVFVAALGVAWVPALRAARWRAVASVVIVAVALVNLIGVSFGIGGTAVVNLDPGHPPTALGERSARFYSPNGFIAGAPRDDSAALEVMKGLKEDGYPAMVFEPNGDITFSSTGLTVMQAIAGLRFPESPNLSALPRRTPFFLRQPLTPGMPQPCGELPGNWGIYVAEQPNVIVAFDKYNLICPF